MFFPNYLANGSSQNRTALLLYDMEGIIGVVSLNENHKKRNYSLLQHELQIVIDNLKKYGIQKIALCDVHNTGKSAHNMLNELKFEGNLIILPFCELWSKSQDYRFAIMLGFHGMKNSGGRFDHTFRSDILSCKIEDVQIGEVGLFSRFLEGQGTQILFISGEGNFIEELEQTLKERVYIHKTKNYYSSMEDVQDEFDRFDNLLLESLKFVKIGAITSINGILRVEVDHMDKYIILSKAPYCFKVTNWGFIFDSIAYFLSEIIDFCIALQKASSIILRKNLDIIKEIKSRQDKIFELKEYLCLPAYCLSETERIKISQILGINYECV